MTYKRENMHTSVVLATQTPMLKSESESMKAREVESITQVPSYKDTMMYL